MTERSVINLQHVDIYQQNNLVLSNVNLTITRGEFVFLIGHSGSGKTSLLKLLYADLPFVKGLGLVNGFNLDKLPESEIPYLRRRLGIIFQDFQLLTDRTVEKNLDFVLKATGWTQKKAITDRIHEVLDKVGMRSKLKKMPHEMSGGEQQRIVIARALLNNPEIILADEPTGNLDPETSAEIVLLLNQISQSGVAVLIATHDYHIIRTCPSRIIQCEGRHLHDNINISDLHTF